MEKLLKNIVKEEINRMVNENLYNKIVLEPGLKVYWEYNRRYFDKILSGKAFGVTTGDYTDKTIKIKLTSTGPNSQPAGRTMNVAIEKLRTVDGKQMLITPKEYEAKTNAAIESNHYID